MFPKEKRIQDKELLKAIRLMPCCVCGVRPVDASHIKTRGAGGADLPFNLVAHCRLHHSEWHQYGPKKFCKRYPVMLFKLRKMGWFFTIDNKLTRVTELFY